MGILGISLIAGVSGSSLPKSLISGSIGLLMACIGFDSITGVTRFGFGLNILKYGIDMLPAMIALIALTQVLQKMSEFKLSDGKLDDASKIDHEGLTKKEIIGIMPATLYSSAIASVLGAMPGVGGGVAPRDTEAAEARSAGVQDSARRYMLVISHISDAEHP